MELWQLYDEQGRPLTGKGGSKDDVYGKGLLHGSAHIWLWRVRDGKLEILLQKRAPNKRTWPDCYDISAAGHIDLGEDPLQAAIRETQEEIGLDLAPTSLTLIGVYRDYMVAPNGAIENELEWIYLVEVTEDQNFTLEAAEVTSLEWISLEDFKASSSSDQYVPHGDHYFTLIITAIEKAAAKQ